MNHDSNLERDSNEPILNINNDVLISNSNSNVKLSSLLDVDCSSNINSHNTDTEIMNVGDDIPSPNSLTEPMECGGNSILSMNSPKHLARILNEDVNMSENNSVSMKNFLICFSFL